MANLTGSRSTFKEQNNFTVDTIRELYDLPASRQALALEYRTLISKGSLSDTDQQRVQELQSLLADYIITAEKWNFLGDVIINMEKFFKTNTVDVVNRLKDEVEQLGALKKNELEQVVTTANQQIQEKVNTVKQDVSTTSQEAVGNITRIAGEKTNEMTTFATQKKEEVNQYVRQEYDKYSNLISGETMKLNKTSQVVLKELKDKTDEAKNKVQEVSQRAISTIESQVQTKTEEITSLVNNKSQQITGLVDSKKQEIETYTDTKKQETERFVTTNNQKVLDELAKMVDRGEYSQSTQYYSKNIVHHNGEVYMAVVDSIGVNPTSSSNWIKLTIKGDTGISVGLSPKGTFDVNTFYQANDLVLYNGSLYYAKKPSRNKQPSTTSDAWGLFLTGMGENLGSLKTGHKESLVGAINENHDRLTNIDGTIANKISQAETKIKGEIQPMINRKADKGHAHSVNDIMQFSQKVNESLNQNTLLTKLKNVDGKNSGLDADLVRGVNLSPVTDDFNKFTQHLSVEKLNMAEERFMLFHGTNIETESVLVNMALTVGQNSEKLRNVVEKESGKGLSTNDFTNDYKQTLTLFEKYKNNMTGFVNDSGLNHLNSLIVPLAWANPNIENLNRKIHELGSDWIEVLHNLHTNRVQIVNDLTTGGANKALSAEQGKLLFQVSVDGKRKLAEAINGHTKTNTLSQRSTFDDFANAIKNQLQKKGEGGSNSGGMLFSSLLESNKQLVHLGSARRLDSASITLSHLIRTFLADPNQWESKYEKLVFVFKKLKTPPDKRFDWYLSESIKGDKVIGVFRNTMLDKSLFVPMYSNGGQTQGCLIEVNVPDLIGTARGFGLNRAKSLYPSFTQMVDANSELDVFVVKVQSGSSSGADLI